MQTVQLRQDDEDQRLAPVQQQQAKGPPLRHGGTQPNQRVRAGVRLFDLKPHGLQHVGQHGGGGVVVIHH